MPPRRKKKPQQKRPPKVVPPDIGSIDKLFEQKMRVCPGPNFERSICELDERKVVINPKHGKYPEDYPETFEDLELPKAMLENIERWGNHIKLTPIQAATYKAIMSVKNHHLMASSPTGTGKTLAFLLPIIKYIFDAIRKHGDDYDETRGAVQPYAIILTTTHEQAIQIYEDALMLCHRTGLEVGLMYGGMQQTKIKKLLPPNTHILVCTFGKLVRLIEIETVSLEAVEIIVLDQADLLLVTSDTALIDKTSGGGDAFSNSHSTLMERFMGMTIDELPKPELEKYIKKMQSVKLEDIIFYMLNKMDDIQLVLMTATQQDYFREFMHQYKMSYKDTTQVMINCENFAANPDIDQYVEKVAFQDKNKKLLEILRHEMTKPDSKGKNITKWLVFVQSNKAVDELMCALDREIDMTDKIMGFEGKMDQAWREVNLNAFISGVCPVLIATRIAGRGLEIDELHHVIQYDLPDPYQTTYAKKGAGKEMPRMKAQFQAEYVNRIGRTGRIGKWGKATSFYDPERDRISAQFLRDVMATTYQVIPPWLLAE